MVGLLAVPVSAAYASVSVSIEALSPSTNITVGQSLAFNVEASGFVNPTYAISDSLSGSSVASGDINSSGDFSWTPTNSDVGTHNLTITVSDSQGNNAQTQESITVSAPASVSIQSLSPGSTITVGQTLSFSVDTTGFTNPSYSISDSLLASNVSNNDINSSGNFSWTPQSSSQDGTHVITVYVTDSLGHSASASETVNVQSAPTVVIGTVSPGTTVNPGQDVTFTATASNFSSPTYSLSDSLGGSSVNNSDINSSGNFSWTPTQNDDGTHTITVFVTDNSGHSATASETITVAGTSVSTGNNANIQGLSPGSSVVVGQPVTFTVAASGFSNPVFSIGDSFGGSSSISNSDINSAGYFTWTPNSSDVGTHNLTIYVNDSQGHTGSVTESLTVNEPNVSVTSVNPGTNVLPNSTLTFVVAPEGFTSPSYTVSDSFSGTTITDSDINSSGDFTWTPATSQDGTHTITIYATDSYGHTANTSITVDVSSGNSVQLSAPTPSTSVSPGTPVSLSAFAYGFTTPTFTLQDSFSGSSLTDSDINSSGEFYWIPTANDAGSHTVTVTATDAYGHFGSAQVTVLVSGNAATSGTSLGQLEAELQQDETAIASAGGTVSGPSSGYVFTTDLSVGMTSSGVTQLQTVLAQQGDFSGTATGYYGSLTEAAVEKFQAAHGIAQVGSVGPETRAALNALMAPETSTSSSSAATVGDGYVFSNFIGYGDTSNDVTELQKRLTALGDYSGPVTGYFGSLTQAAVEKFQGQHDIDQVGYVGPGTRAALN